MSESSPAFGAVDIFYFSRTVRSVVISRMVLIRTFLTADGVRHLLRGFSAVLFSSSGHVCSYSNHTTS